MKTKLFVFALLIFVLLGGIFLFIQRVKTENVDIVINEICPTGCASSGHQWIEIYNKGSEAVDLENWKFWEQDTNHTLNISEQSNNQDFIIEPGEHALIVQNDLVFFQDNSGVTSTVFDSSWGTLNKSGEEIGLKDGSEDLMESFTYRAIENFSLERKDVEELASDEDNWSEHPNSNSVGQENYWKVQDDTGGTGEEDENEIPVAVISASSTVFVYEEVNLDGSTSHDPDGQIISYQWFVNDNLIASEVATNYIFMTTGTFTIRLDVVDDEEGVGTASLDIEVVEGDEEQDGGDGEGEEDESSTTSTIKNLVINEFVADPVSGEKEWIELYNISTSTIDLDGWKLYEGAGKISSPTGTIGVDEFFVVELSSSKLNNGGDIIILKNSEEEIIDQVKYGDWESSGSNAPAASDPNSVARIVDGQDTDNDKNDFAETTSSTKGLPNIIVAPVVEASPNSGGGSGGGGDSSVVSSVTYNVSDIVVNELVADPADEEVEFIEIYNTTNGSIDLSGWWIEDGSEAKTSLTGSISEKGFLAIESPKGNLNNSGDIIIIFSPAGKEIDKITYGKWDDGNLSDNAPVPDDPMSLVRKVDGQDSDNDYYDFVLTSTITKGKANIISSVTEDGEIIEQVVGSSEVIINEVLPNPEGSDSEDEFIELKNIGSETVSLKDWKLGDSSKKRYTIKEGQVKPGGLIVFKRSMTSIALNNSGGEEVNLYNSAGSLVDSIKYSDKADENLSYARREDNSWAWTTKITSGQKNIIEGKSAAPIVSIDVDTEVVAGESIVFDSSDTTDPDGEEMNFTWDFDDGSSDEGDTVEHSFNKEGVYTVKLLVTDKSGNEAEKKVIITAKNGYDFVGGYSGSSDIEKIEISEFVPNPEGSDTTEFIEFFNPTENDIDLSGMKLDDEEGGSKAYTIPENTIIKSQEYLVFGRQDTKLALNNTSDAVRILYPDGTILKEVRFDDVQEGASYIKNEEGMWIWTGSITPGAKNIVTNIRIANSTNVRSSKSKKVKPIINTTLEKVRDEDIGDKVKLTGTVAVEPGILGSQYFYIVGSPGVQIYSYKKDFPKLSVGDKVEITGEISNSSGNTRIKIAQKSDIKKVDHIGEPQARVAEVSEIQEPLEGWLVEVNGEITELKGSYMYVDDGTEEVKVYFKRGAGINKKILQVGDIVKVKGLVMQTKSGYQLLPRSQKDIEKTGVVEDVVVKMENLEGEEKKEVAEKYLTATAGGLTSILFGLFVKSKGTNVFGLFKKVGRFVFVVVRRRKG